MRPALPVFVALLLCAAPARPQTGHPPVLTRPAEAPYPVGARSAHVQGTAEVRFTVDRTGKATGVQAVSGPPLLTRPLEQMIRGWHFATPLPTDAETRFLAVYNYSLVEPDDKPGDRPQAVPPQGADASGDTIYLPGEHATVSGVVRSENNRQEIDVTPADPHPSRTANPAR